MLLNNRPKGISINKNALNIQANNLQQQQPLPFGKQPSKTPSPPQLKSLKQRASENDDLAQLFASHQAQQQHLKDPDQLLKPHQQQQQQQQLLNLDPAPQLQQTQPPIVSEAKVNIDNHNNKQREPTIVQQPSVQQHQGIKRERPKSLIPRLVSEAAERELAKREARYRVAVEEEEPIEDIDEAREDIFMQSDVAKDIYGYMFELEESMAIRRDFLRHQKIYTSKVRHRLISWCVDVVLGPNNLRLLPETMYTTISILDRYFQDVIVKHQNQVQLVAIAGILIASKYEEIYPPEIDDLIHLTRNAYTKRDVLRMEIEMLEKLQFDLGKPIPLAFLRRFSRAAHCDLKMHSIAKWLMETSLPFYECSHWKPSLLAATALFITIYLIHHDSTFARWNRTLQHYTSYTRQQLMEPAATLCKIVKRVPLANAKWVELKSLHVDKLIKLCEQS